MTLLRLATAEKVGKREAMVNLKELFKVVSQNTGRLQGYIQDMYGAQAVHIDSVRTTEALEDDTVWDGMIEVFELHGHREAPIVYAWAQNMNKPGKPRKYSAVLHLNSADSPEAVVRAAFIQGPESGEAS